jgi:hypothetical protein
MAWKFVVFLAAIQSAETPRWANKRAVAAPIPDAPPVMEKTLDSAIVYFFPLFSFRLVFFPSQEGSLS